MKKPILIGVGIVIAFFSLFILADSIFPNEDNNPDENLIVEDFTEPKATSTQKFVDEVYGVEFEYPSFIQLAGSFVETRRSIPFIKGYDFQFRNETKDDFVVSQFIIASTTESDITKMEYTYDAWQPDGRFTISNRQVYSSIFGTALIERKTNLDNNTYSDWFHFIKDGRLYSYLSTFTKNDPELENKANEMFTLFLKTFIVK